MAKFRLTKNKTRKAAIAALCAVAVTCTSLAAACQPDNSGNTEEDTTSATDTSLLTNGSFEFFTVPDDSIYLIKNVQDWSRSGDSSGSLSGIIGTSEKDWGDLTASDLADKLDKNNDLLSSDEKYVDYNGMKSGDIPYRDTYAAKLETSAVKDDKIINKNDMSYAKFLGIKVEGEDDNKTYKYGDKEVYYNEDDGDFYFDAEFTSPVRKDVIKNPETHHGSYSEKDGKHYLGNEEILVDEDGNYYFDTNKNGKVDTLEDESTGHVLMIHNYPTDTKYNGIQQYYSSTTINLEARTAAKISVWVKTSELKFDKGYSLLDEQDRGAFIEVVQTVSGTTIDAFTIKAINTEKILSDNKSLDTNNGWLQYNIYVNSSDFASSTIQLRLGLGKPNGESCTGYAFFDDVTVEKSLKLNEEDLGYSNSIASEIKTNETYCTLSSTDDDKIFYADRAVRGVTSNSEEANRHSTHFNYLIDLASENDGDGEGYKTVALNQANVYAGLTTEKEDKNTTYASAEKFDGTLNGVTQSQTGANYKLYKNTTARPTGSDLLGLFAASDNNVFTGKIKDDAGNKYANALYSSLLEGDVSFKNLPTYDASSNMLVMFSAWGAAYTSTITSDTFTLEKGEQMIVSFWVKTSDMNDKTAATIYLYDTEDTDKENAKVINIDTTGVTTDIEDNKDIYKGWVQCFFFVQNNTKDTEAKHFKIDFCFGNTSISSASSYDGGWTALANMQTLKVTEEVYNLTVTASYTQKFQFNTEDKEKSHNKFAEAQGTYDINEEIALPDGYNGVNGASSSVSSEDYSHNYDVWNTNHIAGLINRDNFFDDDGNSHDWQGVLDSFIASATNWDDVFGKDCYQPLIIVNNLRRYADNAHANKDNYTNYYILAEDEYSGDDVVFDNNNRRYRKATADDGFDEDETYYSFKEVVNYGFVGSSKTVSSNSTEIITVKVMVTGNAKAYIYLVDTTTREVMGYSAPGYTFFYDNEGNVLDEEFDEKWNDDERDEHTIYDKQDNGLYKDKDGNYVANLYNLKKIYYKKDGAQYWYDGGNGERKEYKGKKLEEGVDYYADKDSDVPSPHRLCNSDNKPIYEYKEGNSYYYIVNGKVTDTVVKPFDTNLAKLKYDYSGNALDEAKYFVEVGNTEDNSGNPKWVTVNFVVKTGNKSKTYRLELWSGKRDESGVNENGSYDNGAVAFDYSSYSITSSNYDSILRTDADSYEKTVIAEYQKLLAGHEDRFALEDEATIKYYEDLAEELINEIDADELKELKASYTAHYYTYSLYDSEVFIPFNKEVAENGETDYDYTAPDSESLAFFSNKTKDKDNKIISYNMFIDYSAVEQEVSKTNAPTDGNTGSDNDNNATAGDFWLQLASILLVVVLLFVLLALVARIVIKRIRRKIAVKKQSKNVYRKRERYMRKLHITAEETEEIENPALQNNEAEEPSADEAEVTPAEDAPVEEAPAEETPADAPAEEVKEAPVETTETPSESSEDKPE